MSGWDKIVRQTPQKARIHPSLGKKQKKGSDKADKDIYSTIEKKRKYDEDFLIYKEEKKYNSNSMLNINDLYTLKNKEKNI